MPNEHNLSEDRIRKKISGDTTPPKGNRKILGLVLGTILIICIVVAVIIFIKPNNAETRNTIVTPDNVDEILADLNKEHTPTGNYEVTMNTTWDFTNGNSISKNAYVENSTANKNDVYFDIVRSDNNETIYKSPIIPLGSHLENIALDKNLEKGSYDCILTYHLLDKDKHPVSKLKISLVININS